MNAKEKLPRDNHDRLRALADAPRISLDDLTSKICGTSLGEILSEDATFPIAINALDRETGLKNQFHEFTSEKPGWDEICDYAPQSAARNTQAAEITEARKWCGADRDRYLAVIAATL